MTTLSASLDIIDLSDGVLTKSAEGQRTIVTEDAADLPLLTLEPVYGESVQDGTPSPSAPVYIKAVRARNLVNVPDKSGTQTGYWWGFSLHYHVKPGTYTVSFDVVGSTQTQTTIGLSHADTDGAAYEYDLPIVRTSYGTRRYVVFTVTQTQIDSKGDWLSIRTDRSDSSHTSTITVSNIMLMYGNNVDAPYIPYGHLSVICSNNNTKYIDLKGNELHGFDSTYRDILSIDASGHVTVEKRTGKITIEDIDRVGTAATGIYFFAKNSLRIAPEANGTTPTRAKSNMFAANQWSGSWYADKIFVNPSSPMPQFTHSNSSATTLAEAKTVFAGFECVYPLQESDWYDIDLGYVDLPEVTDGSTVYVAAEIQPVIGGSWWTQAGLAAGEAFKDNRDEDWTSRLMVTNAQMAIDKINGQIQTLVSGLDGMTTLTQTDSGFEFTVDDSLTSLLNGLQTDYNSLIHDLGVVVGNHTTELGVLSNYVQVTTENNQPVLRLGSSSNPIVAVLTNTGLEFRQSENGTESIVAYLAVDDDGRGKLKVNTAVVLDTLQFGNWEWYTRPNGNMSIRWIGE